MTSAPLEGGYGLPLYTIGPTDWHTDRKAKVTREEATDVKCLMKKIDLQLRGLTSNDLTATWMSQRIQPLQA